jgi:hypothetical protein
MSLKALACGIFASALAIGCTISPVVSTSEPTARYADCERAAEAYCEEVVGVGGHKLDKCVAEKRFECVSGSAD